MGNQMQHTGTHLQPRNHGKKRKHSKAKDLPGRTQTSLSLVLSVSAAQ